MAELTARHPTRGVIDRAHPLSFSFNGKPCLGFVGDTLASALLANGIQITGGSLSSNRPRAINGIGEDDTQAYVRLHEDAGERIVHATEQELYEGLQAESIAPWPPLGLIDRIRGREIKRPPISILRHEWATPTADSQVIVQHCDVLVIGGGPAGLSAALGAEQSGKRAIVLDTAMHLGGTLLSTNAKIGGQSGKDWCEKTITRLATAKDISFLTRSHTVGIDEQNRVIVLSRLPDENPSTQPTDIASGHRFLLRKINAGEIILATGARERLLPFAGNDTPGVWQASSLVHLYCQFGIDFPDARTVVVTNNDGGYDQACLLHDIGFNVSAVVDCRSALASSTVKPAIDRGIDIVGGYKVEKVIEQQNTVAALDITSVEASRRSDSVELACDLVAVSGGWSPRLQFVDHCGRDAVDHIVGGAAGTGSLYDALARGWRAGSGIEDVPDSFQTQEAPRETTAPAPYPYSSDSRQNRAAVWLTSQPDTNLQGLYKQLEKDTDALDTAIAADLKAPKPASVSFDQVMTRMNREFTAPRRLLPTHDLQVERGAAFRLTRQWLRPALYPSAETSHEEAVAKEMWAARNTAAISDLSAIGKVGIRGKEAARFLEYMLTSPVKDMAEQHARYTMVLDESGRILDHGVLVRLAHDHFHLFTSPGMSAEICSWLQNWQREEFETSPLFISNLAEQMAVLMVTGPRARQVLLELKKDIDLSTAALPHLAATSGTIENIPATIVRTAYTGEPTFELHVPADAASYLWNKILDTGRKFDLRPLGEEALTRLAAEKGRLDLSTVPDEALSPADISVHRPRNIKSANFVGKKALGRRSNGAHLQLVALKSENPDDHLPLRGVLRQSNDDEAQHSSSEGFILTSFMSVALRQRITLALLENGHDRIGETSLFETEAGTVSLHVARPTIFDPNERRRHG